MRGLGTEGLIQIVNVVRVREYLDVDNRPGLFRIDPVGPGADLLCFDQHLGEIVQLPDRVRVLCLKPIDNALGLLRDSPPERSRAAQLLALSTISSGGAGSLTSGRACKTAVLSCLTRLSSFQCSRKALPRIASAEMPNMAPNSSLVCWPLSQMTLTASQLMSVRALAITGGLIWQRAVDLQYFA